MKPLFETPKTVPEDHAEGNALAIDAGIDVSALFARIWRRRVPVLLLAFFGMLLAGGVGLAVYILRPATTEARLSFQLLFEGVGKREFPDHSPFNPADIVSSSVLGEVYRRNPIQAYVSFDKFKSGFSILEAGPQLERLQREYEERLSNRTLTSADRKRIEDEFNGRTESLKGGEFTIVAEFGERVQRWPTGLCAKILNDVLNVWAEQSRSRGVFEFDLAVPSRNVLPQSAVGQEPLLLLNQLRVIATQIIHDIEQLSKIPGASLARVGEKRVSLGELQAHAEDLVKFRLAPAEAYLAATGAVQNRSLVESFLKEQVAQLEAQVAEGQERVEARKTLQARGPWNGALTLNEGGSTAGSNALVTQLNEGFLERLIELFRATSELPFRQRMTREALEAGEQIFALGGERAIYQQRLSTVAALPSSGAGAQGNVEGSETEFRQLTEALGSILDDLQLLYAEVSRTNLQSSMAFDVVAPARQKLVSEFPMTRIAWALAGAYLVFIVGVLVWAMWRSETTPPVR